MPHKEEFPSGGNKKRGKTVQFDVTTEEVNITTSRDVSVPIITRGKVKQTRLRVTRMRSAYKYKNAFRYPYEIVRT